jgi:6-pyruvoyltetrahydropterin/6-carboxytetrahydropterin synthase
MIEVGVARSFHALHQLVEDPASVPHGHEHDYRVEAVVRGETLPEVGMLLDLDALGAALSECLDELDASDLDAMPAFQGRSTTVEVVSEHVWHHVRERIGRSPPLESLRVTVYESPDAWASVDQRLDD